MALDAVEFLLAKLNVASEARDRVLADEEATLTQREQLDRKLERARQLADELTLRIDHLRSLLDEAGCDAQLPPGQISPPESVDVRAYAARGQRNPIGALRRDATALLAQERGPWTVAMLSAALSDVPDERFRKRVREILRRMVAVGEVVRVDGGYVLAIPVGVAAALEVSVTS